MRRLVLGIGVALALTLAAPAAGAPPREAQAVVRATKQDERDWLAHRTHASCSHYTGTAKRKLVAELGVAFTCEGTLKVVFDLMGPDDAAQIRHTLRTLTAAAVTVGGDRARVALSGGRTLKLRRIAGRWFISDPSTDD